jgi:hypothetical protein
MNEAINQKLSEYDFIVAIDASGSMGERDMPGGKSRWEYMQETALAFTRDLEVHDSDGIDVIIFGGSNVKLCKQLSKRPARATRKTSSSCSPMACPMTKPVQPKPLSSKAISKKLTTH